MRTSALPRQSLRLVVAAALCASACFPPDDGRSPPLDQLYFPVGLAVDPERSRLYVANSDFDLQYNAGTLQAFDLQKLRQVLPRHCRSDADCASVGRVCDVEGSAAAAPSHWCVDPGSREPCGSLGEQTAAARLLSPARCNPVDPESPPGGVGSLLVDRVSIGAFVTDVVFQPRPAGVEAGPPGRLFLPVRGDDTLHWVDVTPGVAGSELDCGQGKDGLCDGAHRRGDDPAGENTRAVSLPPEPFGVAVDELGEAILTTHQTTGSVGLFVNQWEGGPAGGPYLQHVLEGLPSGALGVAAVPNPKAVLEERLRLRDAPGSGTNLLPAIPYQQSFLVTFRTSPEVRLVRYFDERYSGNLAASPSRPFVEASRSARISANADGFNSRGIAIDASRRGACEAECDSGTADRDACLRGCLSLGLDVYVANRSPSSLIVGGTQVNPDYAACLASGDCVTPPPDLPRFFDAFPLSFGASRVVKGNVRDADGTRVPRIFVVCFDSKQVVIFDPATSRVEAVIRTGRGPHALAIDDGAADVGDQAFGYIAHFTDSYIGVVDLNLGHDTYGEVILILGEPSPPRAQK